MASQNQQSTFSLRIAQSGGADRCTATNDNAAPAAYPTLRLADSESSQSTTIDLIAAYRSSRLASQYTQSSMRHVSAFRVGSYHRRVA